ncbi:hypothetical protein HGRIS_011789 [Hohenbuehelia grisea]|uniref:WD40 repeat-like protein n=1 Tax=Hohenbuehelia grisea TaxID=104357 RepID=A0ABR3JW66_9AGAR
MDYLSRLPSQKLQSKDVAAQQDYLFFRWFASMGTGCITRPIIFAIDAVDECPRHELQYLLDILSKFISQPELPSNIRFLFTYRSDDSIHSIFSNIEDSIRSMSIDHTPDTESDIHNVVQYELRHLSHADGLVEAITTASQGLFECAAVLCRELKTRGRPASSTSREEFVRRIGKTPGMSLYTLYREILDDYLYDARLLKIFRRVMAWILLVETPQSRPVIYSFAQILVPEKRYQDDVATVLASLGSLLSGTMADDVPISPLHASLRDFLIDPASGSGVYFIDLGLSAQVDIARDCFKIMNKQLKFNICWLPTSFQYYTDVEDLAKRVADNISPGLQYACTFAPRHLYSTRMALRPMTILESIARLIGVFFFLSGSLDDTMVDDFRNIQAFTVQETVPLEEDVRFFLENKFLYWLEAHSCMGTRRNGPGVQLPIIREWAEFKGLQQIEGYVADFIVFEQRFREGYQASAPQIYLSGLAFTPTTSAVSRLYKPVFCGIMRAKGIDTESDNTGPQVITTGTRIYSAVFSPDDSLIVSGFDDGTIHLWNAQTGEQLGDSLRGHTGGVLSVAFSPDSVHIVSGSADNTIRLWSTKTLKQVGNTLVGHTNEVNSVVFSPDGTRVVSGSDDETGGPVGDPLMGHGDRVWSVAFSPSGAHIVSGSKDRRIRLWDAQTREPLGAPFTGHDRSVLCVAFSQDGSRIVSGSADRTIRQWNTVTRAQIRNPLTGHTSWVRSVVFSPDGSIIASASDDETIRLWSAVTGEQIGEPLAGHNDWVRCIAFSSDSSKILSGSDDGTLRLWDAQTREQASASPIGHDRAVKSVAFSPDGSQIVSGSDDNTIRLWDGQTGEPVGDPLIGHGDDVLCVAFSKDASRVVSGSGDDTIRQWSSQTRVHIGDPLIGHSDWVRSAAFSPDDTLIASGSADHTVRLWDARTGEQRGDPLTGHIGGVRYVDFSPDGTYVVSGSEDKTIRRWDSQTGKPIGQPLTGHTNTVGSVAFSPDGLYIISGSRDKTIRLWDAESGDPIGDPLTGHRSAVRSVAFSPDSLFIVSGSSDHTIRLWDRRTGNQVCAPLTEHQYSVNSVAFSPDGSRIASASDDRTVRVWDVSSLAESARSPADEESAAPVDHLSSHSPYLIHPTASLAQHVRPQPHHTFYYPGTDEFIQCLADDREQPALWIPHSYRQCVFSWDPRARIIISKDRHIVLEYDTLHMGEDWVNILKPQREPAST